MCARRPIFKRRGANIRCLGGVAGTVWSTGNFSLRRLCGSCSAHEGGKWGRCLDRDVRVSHHRHTARHQTHHSQATPRVLLRTLPLLSCASTRRDRARRSGRRRAAILAGHDVSRSRGPRPQRGRIQNIYLDAGVEGGAPWASWTRPGCAVKCFMFSPMKRAPGGRFSNVEERMFEAWGGWRTRLRARRIFVWGGGASVAARARSGGGRYL